MEYKNVVFLRNEVSIPSQNIKKDAKESCQRAFLARWCDYLSIFYILASVCIFYILDKKKRIFLQILSSYVLSKPHTASLIHIFKLKKHSILISIRISPRPISTPQLKALRPLHSVPINLVVFKGSYFINEWDILS